MLLVAKIPIRLTPIGFALLVLAIFFIFKKYTSPLNVLAEHQDLLILQMGLGKTESMNT